MDGKSESFRTNEAVFALYKARLELSRLRILVGLYRGMLTDEQMADADTAYRVRVFTREAQEQDERLRVYLFREYAGEEP